MFSDEAEAGPGVVVPQETRNVAAIELATTPNNPKIVFFILLFDSNARHFYSNQFCKFQPGRKPDHADRLASGCKTLGSP